MQCYNANIRTFYLFLTTFLLITPNLHSQTEQLNKVLRNNFIDPFSGLEKKIDKNTFEKESFENYSNEILKAATFDSSSVVDSVVVSSYQYGTQKKSYTYNLDGNINSCLHEYWEGSKWVYSRRESYIYDSKGNMTSRLYENWSNTKWVNSSQRTYTYDSNENLTLILTDWWEESQWVYKSRTTYTYDSKSNMILELRKRWEGGQWVNSWQYTYTYDFNGIMALYFKENWDGSQWVSEWRRNYTYNSTGNMTLDLLEIWVEGQWVNDKRSIYTYDSNENMPLALAESWDGSSWVQNKMGELSFYDSFGRKYNYLAYEANIYYSIITDVEKTAFNVSDYCLSQNYPNPFNPSTTIKYSIPNVGAGHAPTVQLKVYDVLGRKVATLVNKEQSAGNYEVQFDASNLTSGIYFYKLQSGNFVESKKMVLVK